MPVVRHAFSEDEFQAPKGPFELGDVLDPFEEGGRRLRRHVNGHGGVRIIVHSGNHGRKRNPEIERVGIEAVPLPAGIGIEENAAQDVSAGLVDESHGHGEVLENLSVEADRPLLRVRRRGIVRHARFEEARTINAKILVLKCEGVRSVDDSVLVFVVPGQSVEPVRAQRMKKTSDVRTQVFRVAGERSLEHGRSR